MYILGDIGNSETKVFLVNSNDRIIRQVNFISKKINAKILSSKLNFLVKDLCGLSLERSFFETRIVPLKPGVVGLNLLSFI